MEWNDFRSILVGRSSHKVTDVNANIVMRIYYRKEVLTFMCCVNELFYICLYLLNFTHGPIGIFQNRREEQQMFCSMQKIF